MARPSSRGETAGALLPRTPCPAEAADGHPTSSERWPWAGVPTTERHRHMELTREQKIFTFVGTLLGLLLGALDQTVVATAAPTIVEQLHIPPSLYVWITTSYMLASTVLVPVWGKLSDLYGRRKVVISGIALFL